MTNGSSFLPEGMSMDAFVEQASYEELTQAYRMLVATADSPDDHTSPEIGAVLSATVERILPELRENGLSLSEEDIRNAVFADHMDVNNNAGTMTGPTGIDRIINIAESQNIDTSALRDLGAVIDESNDTWRALEGTLGPNPNPSAFIGTYVDAGMQVWEAERTIERLGADADPAALAAAQTDLAVGQALQGRINAALPEDMRDDAAQAFANAQNHELRREDGDLPYQRIGAAAGYAFENPGRAAVLGWQGVETLGSNLLATPGYLLDLGNMASGWAFDASYEGSAGDWMQRNSLGAIDFVTGTPEIRSREESDIVNGVAGIGEAAVIVGSLGTMAAPRAAATIPRAVARSTDEAVETARPIIATADEIPAVPNAMDDMLIASDEFAGARSVAVGGTDDALEITARAASVPGTYAPANMLTPPMNIVADAAPGLRVADDVPVSRVEPPHLAAQTAEEVPSIIDAPTSIPRVTRGEPQQGPWGPRAAAGADDAPVNRTAPEQPQAPATGNAGLGDSATEAARPGAFSRAFNYLSPNGPRAVYIGDAPAAERLSLLASRGEEATPYMERIVRDIRAGRTQITSDAIDGLRNGGRMPDSVMEGLDTAQGMLRADGAMGKWLSYRFSSEAIGDTLRAPLPTIPTASLGGAGRLTFGTLDAATSPFRVDRLVNPASSYFGGVGRTALATGTIYVGDELAFDGAGRNLAFGLYESGTDAVGYAGEYVGELGEDGTPLGTAANVTSTALTWGSDLAASGAGYVNAGLDFGLSAANPFDNEVTPDTDAAPVVATTDPEGATVNASAGPQSHPEQMEAQMFGMVERLANSPVGDFLDNIGPWGQMIAAAIGIMMTGKVAQLIGGQMPGIGGMMNSGLAGLALFGGALYMAPRLADAFHNARDNEGPAPSEHVSNVFNRQNAGRLWDDTREFGRVVSGQEEYDPNAQRQPLTFSAPGMF